MNQSHSRRSYFQQAKTSVQYCTFDPFWGEHFIFAVRKSDLAKGSIRVEIWDDDSLNDEFIGHFTIALNSLQKRYTFWKKNDKHYTSQDALKTLGRTSSISFDSGCVKRWICHLYEDGQIIRTALSFFLFVYYYFFPKKNYSESGSDYDKKLPIRCKPMRYPILRPAGNKRNNENRAGEVEVSCHMDLDAHLAESQQLPIAQLHINVLSASNFLPKDSNVQVIAPPSPFPSLPLSSHPHTFKKPKGSNTRICHSLTNTVLLPTELSRE